MRLRFENNARSLDLTRTQWQAVAYVARNAGINQARLAELMEVKPITLVPIIDKLEARGLLLRERDPDDRRARLLHLTEAAAPTLKTMQGIGESTRQEALTGLTEEECDELYTLLARIKHNLVTLRGLATDTR